MAHASGNPTWRNKPNHTTPITAGALENIEGAIDDVDGRVDALEQPAGAIYAGHADQAPQGTFWVSTPSAANGYPAGMTDPVAVVATWRAYGPNYLLQRMTGESGVTWSRVMRGGTWSAWWTDRNSGTGSPEGVVTAPVGSVYTDTAGTFGAVEWVKVTGTGSTGWQVSHGDTGDVDVTSQCTVAGAAPIAGDKVTIRRTPGGITYWVDVASRPAPPNMLPITVPTWARPISTRLTAVAIKGAQPTHMLSANGTSSELRLWGLPAGGGPYYVPGLTVLAAPTATPWRS